MSDEVHELQNYNQCNIEMSRNESTHSKSNWPNWANLSNTDNSKY